MKKNYVFVLLIGILMFLLSFFSVMRFFGEDIKKEKNNIREEKEIEIKKNEDLEKKGIFLVKEIKSNKIKVWDIKNKIESEIEINEKENKFKRWDIVNISFKNGEIKEIELNKDSWDKNRINGFEFDLEKKELMYKGKKYFFDKDVFVDDNYDLEKISDMSVISLKGIGKRIIYIKVDKGAGKIIFIEKDKILNGRVKIDKDGEIELREIDFKDLIEGAHRIFISGDNIEDYVKDFFIRDREKINFDLSEIKLKSGLLRLNLEEDGCLVYIDKNKIDLVSEGIFLDYGWHEIKIKKDGYEDYEEKFLINDKEKEINISLVKEIDMGKIIIKVEPGDAEIFLDDAKIGTGFVEKKIEYGNHVIYVKKEKYSGIELPVEINKSVANYKIKLKPEKNLVDE